MHPLRTDFRPEPRTSQVVDHPLFSALMLVFWVAVIFGLVVLISKFVNHTASKNQQSVETPLDIAKTRYAKGEITKEEFGQLKKDLG